MATATDTITPESVKPALANLDPVRREILWIMAHLPQAHQAGLLVVAEAMAARKKI